MTERVGTPRTWETLLRGALITGSIAAALASVERADAAYNANMVGVVAAYWSYTEHDAIYFVLRNQPSTHPACNPAYFVVPGTVPPDRRKMIFARLALAYAIGETVNVGYDGTGECASGYIQVHRVG
jgi:hypothetical protein